MVTEQKKFTRKDFLKQSSIVAVGLSVFGTVIFRNGVYTGDCKTTSDMLGPYYRPGAPFTNDLTWSGQNGEPILVKGKVYADDCITPLDGALVEVWHADETGEYVEKENNIVNSAQFNIDSEGTYRFKTVFPGHFNTRPRHIHYRITGPGHKELISQLYFAGDPNIEKHEPNLLKSAKKRILPLTEIPDGTREITFDIFMQQS